ncbi:hypothetical protein [Flammeovirga sp. SubArs3]|uniref:hypothetical protein n=1 Tax=Flammeovirga sp. SubArs3 TaxID=2995316 RepID=UPI00248D2651|nr:hypothetical protein [Flammeovirga sp. SubArs3]
MRGIYLVIFIFHTFLLYGQGNYYWQQQQGANGNLLGGSLASGATDNSAIYYNPGALAFTETPNVSFTSDLIGYTILNIKNGAGEGVDIKGNSLETKPQMVAGTAFKYNKQKFKVTYAFINLLNSKHEFAVQNSGSVNGSNVFFEGYFNYKSLLRNDRFAIGTTYRLSEKIGVGITHFLDIKSAQITSNVDQTWANGNGVQDTFSDFTNLRFNHASLLWKIGIAWHVNQNLNLGFNFDTPDIRIKFLSKSTARKIREKTLDDGSISKEISTQDKVYSNYKLPFTAEFNIGYTINKVDLSGRVGIFSKVDRYGMLELQPESSTFSPLDQSFSQYYSANKVIYNAAVGVKSRLIKSMNFLSGFRTDFNIVDQNQVNPHAENVLSYDYWDLYHISAGIEWFGPRFNIIAGLVTDLGFSNGDPQYVNLTPRDYSQLNEFQSNTESSFVQFNLVFGITYHFVDKTQL